MSAHLKPIQNPPRSARSRSTLGRLPWLVGLAALGVSQLGAGCQSVQNLVPINVGNATSFGDGA